MSIVNKLLVILGIGCISFLSCEKYTDPNAPNIDEQLDNKYCNIPTAVNYNWNFPGIEDNSTCFYSWDFYEGTWEFISEVYAVNNNVDKLYDDTIVLSFSKKTSDTTYSKMVVNGWCPNGQFDITLDRFYIATTDSFPNGENYQIVCDDTLKGNFEKYISDTTVLNLKLTVNKPSGQYNYIGIGKRL